MSANNQKSNSQRFRRIKGYILQHRRYVIMGIISLIITNGLMLLIPFISKLIIDDLQSGEPLDVIGQWVLIMIGLAVGAGFFRFLTRRTIIWMSRRIEYTLRSDLADHLLSRPQSFFDQSRTGDLMVRVTSDVEAVRMMVGPGIMQFSNATITLMVAFPMMLYLSPRLTLYALAPAIVLPLIVNRLGNKVHEKSTKIQDHFSKLTAAAQENLAGIRVVKAYRQEEAEIAHFHEMSDEYRALYVDFGKLQAMFFPLIHIIGFSLTLVALYFGGREVILEKIQLGTMVAFLAYLGALLWPMMAVGWVVSLYQRGKASLDRINAIFEESSDHVDGSIDHKAAIKGEIEFRNLTFSYNGQDVLKGVNLKVVPGETVGILGPTASGKTTLVSLLARLYPIKRGMLFIDKVDINDWQTEHLRKQIGFATQESFLFSDTIHGNVAFGSGEVLRDEVERVSRVAALDKDVSAFPYHYDTIVGERGITLSGGQKQRTAIARALLINPAILILDDATSSVDTETEQEINERISEYSDSLTTLIISHRVSSVKDADKIIFLEDGKIIEEGTHDSLIELDNRYAALYRAQLLAEQLEQL